MQRPILWRLAVFIRHISAHKNERCWQITKSLLSAKYLSYSIHAKRWRSERPPSQNWEYQSRSVEINKSTTKSYEINLPSRYVLLAKPKFMFFFSLNLWWKRAFRFVSWCHLAAKIATANHRKFITENRWKTVLTDYASSYSQRQFIWRFGIVISDYNPNFILSNVSVFDGC